MIGREGLNPQFVIPSDYNNIDNSAIETVFLRRIDELAPRLEYRLSDFRGLLKFNELANGIGLRGLSAGVSVNDIRRSIFERVSNRIENERLCKQLGNWYKNIEKQKSLKLAIEAGTIIYDENAPARTIYIKFNSASVSDVRAFIRSLRAKRPLEYLLIDNSGKFRLFLRFNEPVELFSSDYANLQDAIERSGLEILRISALFDPENLAENVSFKALSDEHDYVRFSTSRGWRRIESRIESQIISLIETGEHLDDIAQSWTDTLEVNVNGRIIARRKSVRIKDYREIRELAFREWTNEIRNPKIGVSPTRMRYKFGRLIRRAYFERIRNGRYEFLTRSIDAFNIYSDRDVEMVANYLTEKLFERYEALFNRRIVSVESLALRAFLRSCALAPVID